MAIKAEISFKVFDGVRTNFVRKTTYKNSINEFKEFVFEFIRKEYPELKQSDITKEDIRISFGIIEIEAERDGKLFKLEINRVS